MLGEDPAGLGIRFVADADGRGDGITAIELEGDAEEVRRRAKARNRLDGDRIRVGGVEIRIL